MPTTSDQHIHDAYLIEKRQYQVTFALTNGVELSKYTVEAGSEAHAAAMAAIDTYERLRGEFTWFNDPDGKKFDTFEHNMCDHTVVIVGLVG